MIKIDKGVALPTREGYGRGFRKYPWREMEVGDSFFVKGKTPADMCVSNPHRMYPGKRFATATVAGGVRVWRVK